MNRVGIVAFSFALREEEPNPCNIRLAKEVKKAVSRYPDALIVCQWEVGIAVAEGGYLPVRIIGPFSGVYLDSETVWQGAMMDLWREGITDVIPIAQPFLHLTKVKRMIRKSGFNIVPWKVPWIGFDNDPRNTQEWTKGPLRLLIYALKQLLLRSKG